MRRERKRGDKIDEDKSLRNLYYIILFLFAIIVHTVSIAMYMKYRPPEAALTPFDNINEDDSFPLSTVG